MSVCTNGRPCDEVRLRLIAADLLARHGCREHAEQLRAIARRIAAVHHWGAPVTR